MELILFLVGVGFVIYALNRVGEAERRIRDLESKTRSSDMYRGNGGARPLSSAPEPSQPSQVPLEQSLHGAEPSAVREVNYTVAGGMGAPPNIPPTNTPSPAPSPSSDSQSFEEMVGGGLLTKVGITAILFGVGFFLKHAFDNEWIGPVGQVMMGIFAGLFLVILGDFLREKYRAYALSLVGGGIGLLYLSISVAYEYYRLIESITVASLLFGFITFFGVVLSLRYDSLVLAGLAVFGGFLTPFLVPTQTNNIFGLFTYIIILDIGILAISIMKRWKPLNLLGMAGTFVVFSHWYGRFYTPDQLFVTEFFVTVFFVIFSLSLIIYLMFRDDEVTAGDVLMTAVVPAAYFMVSYNLLTPQYNDFMGFFAALLALWYLFLAYIGYEIHKSDANLVNTLAGTAIVFLTVAIPLQFEGTWITIAWGVEAFFLTWIAFMLGSRALRLFGLGVLAVALVRLFVFDNNVSNIMDYTVLWNVRFVTFLMVAFAIGGIAVLYKKYEDQVGPEDASAVPVLVVMVNVLLVYILNSEILMYFAKQRAIVYENISEAQRMAFDTRQAQAGYQAELASIENTRNVSISLFWILYSAILLVAGIIVRSRHARLIAIALFGVTILKVFLYDSSALDGVYRIISFITLGVILLITSFLYQRYRERISEFILKT